MTLRPDHHGPRRRRPLPRADRRARSPTCATFAKSLGGSATNVAVAAARLGARAAVITKVGDDPFGPYVRGALRGFGVDDALGRHAPDAAHAGRLLRDPPARRLPAALLPRAEGAGHDARGRRARPRRDPRGARVLDDRHRAVGRAEPRGDAGRARGARRRRRDHRPRPRPPADVLARRVRGRPLGARGAARTRRSRSATATRSRSRSARATRTRRRRALLELGVEVAIVKQGPGGRARAHAPTASSRCRRCRSRSSAGSAPATRSAARSCTGCCRAGTLERAVRLANAAGALRRRRGSRAPTRCRPCELELAGGAGMRLTVAQALVRFLAAQESSATASAAASSPAASASSATATSPGSARRCSSTPTCCPTTRRATSRRWSTSPPATRASATGSATFACTTSVGPGATNMVTGAALATDQPAAGAAAAGRHVRHARAAPGAPAARGAARRDAVGQRLLPAGVALLRPRSSGPSSSCPPRSRRCACSPTRPRPARSRSRCPRTCRPRRSTCPTAFLEPRVVDGLPPAAGARGARARRRAGARRAAPADRRRRRRDLQRGDRRAARVRRRDRHPGRARRRPAAARCAPTTRSSLGAVGATGTRGGQPARARGRPRDRRRHALERLHDRLEVGLPGPGRALRQRQRRGASTPPSTAGWRSWPTRALALEALREALAGHRADAAWERARGRGGARVGDGGRSGSSAPRDGALPSQAAVIGAVNDAAGETGVVVCAAGSMPGDLHKLWRARDPEARATTSSTATRAWATRSRAAWASSSPRPSARCS